MPAAAAEKATEATTKKAKAFYEENGYLVLPKALSLDEIKALREDTVRLCRGKYGKVPGRDQDIESSTKPEKPSDEDVMRDYLCIHFPHKISHIFMEAITHPAIVRGLNTAIGPNVKCMQSMLFIKAAGKPGQAWHQDEIYIPTRDRSLTGAWIAMDDATVDNGCLWVIPGSHRPGILWPQREHQDRRFDCAHETYSYPFTDNDAIPVEVETGSVVLFNGYLLHRSLPNVRKTGFRRSLVNHYMSAESLLPWHKPEGEVGMARADFRDIVMVSGSDPYAYKGIEDRSRPHIRASGEGGCGNAKRNLKPTDA